MLELFDDFDISTDSNAGFTLSLNEDGVLEYKLLFVEKESIKIHLTSKSTGETFSVNSSGDENLLKEMNKAYVYVNRDFNRFRSYYE